MTAASRTTALAFGCIVSWLVAAASAGWIGLWPAIGGAAVALGIVVLRLEGPDARALLRPRLGLVVLGAASGGSMVAVTYLVYPVLAGSLPAISLETGLLLAAFRAPSPAVAWLALAPIVAGEELVWRGVVQGALMQRLGRWSGVALTAIAYALVLAPLGSPVLVGVALACGLAWGALRAVTESLVPSLVAHLSWDVLVLLWLSMCPPNVGG